jgi:serine/threonine-protein phosphatase 2A regulatory subunit B
MSRDYLGLKLWDLRATSHKPTAGYYVCDYLEKNLCNLYEEDSIYDKFFMDMSPCGKYALTGNYNKNAHIIDIAGTNNVTFQANFDMKIGKVQAKTRKYNEKKKLSALDSSTIDFKKKVLNGCWSPKDNIVACGFRNCLFLYQEKR